jgi:hypothetical protein
MSRALADEESSQRLSAAKRRDIVSTLAALPLANEGRSSHNVSSFAEQQDPIASEAGRSRTGYLHGGQVVPVSQSCGCRTTAGKIECHAAQVCRISDMHPKGLTSLPELPHMEG